ncbi:WD40-repeat-containing domain protein [Suillus variegatus]|nr:WD40-repeat-containing domain protein [Suillus variegatus]
MGEAWKVKEGGIVWVIALSPGGKIVASGSEDGGVRLWDIDTGKVVKKFTGHTEGVFSVCWSPDGGRVVSGSNDDTFRVWDVKSSEMILILAPKIADFKFTQWLICEYSADGDMIATVTHWGGILKIWNANTGELLKTLDENATCMTWTSDTLITGGWDQMKKFNIPTWTKIAVLNLEHNLYKSIPDKHTIFYVSDGIALSPNERILAGVYNETVQLWNFANNQPIGLPLHHEAQVRCMAFSADGKLLVTCCWLPENDWSDPQKSHIYTWDVSAIVREAGLEDLLSDNDVCCIMSRQKPRILILSSQNAVKKLLLDFDASRRLASQGRRDRQPLSTPKFLLGRLTSLWRRPDSHGPTERNTISRPHPLNWAQHFVSDMLHRRSETDIELREIPVVDVPYTSGKPRNYHARKKPSASSSRPPNSHTTQQPSAATQNTPSSSQGPPAISTTSEALPAVATTTLATETTSRHNITVIQAGCWIRFLLWIGCASIEYTNDQH